MKHCFLKIRVNAGPYTTVGMPDQTSISLRLSHSSGDESPNFSVSSFLTDGESLKCRHEWGFEKLAISDEISITLISQGEPDPPSKIDDKRPVLTRDEAIIIDEHVRQLQRMIKEIEGDTAQGPGLTNPEESPGPFCSFCGKSRNEVRKLIAGPSVFICDQCVSLSVDILVKEFRK